MLRTILAALLCVSAAACGPVDADPRLIPPGTNWLCVSTPGNPLGYHNCFRPEVGCGPSDTCEQKPAAWCFTSNGRADCQTTARDCDTYRESQCYQRDCSLCGWFE